MMDRAPRRLLALLLLIFGILAWSAVTSLHAQAPQAPANPPPPTPVPEPPKPTSPAKPHAIFFTGTEYSCQPGDKFETLSKRFYKSKKYAAALRRHNQNHARASDQMAQSGTITPGEKIFIPPADILEQRYPDAIGKSPSSLPPQNQPAPPPDARPTPPRVEDAPAIPAPPAARFQFKIDPKTPLKELLPTPPKTRKITGPMLSDDLTRVPEIHFQAAAAKDVPSAEAMKQIAHQIAKINHLNDKKTDGFIEALRSERLDLNGLSFAMGDACRTKGERSRQFARAVATVRSALEPRPIITGLRPVASPPVPSDSAKPSQEAPAPASTPERSSVTFTNEPTFKADIDPPSADVFWKRYHKGCAQEDEAQGRIRREQCETITLARIAALMQILAPMPDLHAGLVKYLSTLSHVEATRALARLAIFSSEEEARKAAIDALKVRRERDYTEILVKGLRYPWPVVARRAAEAIAKLERDDLLPKLVDLLEEDDPRAPETREVNQKRVPVVRELVRVNHHRSCLLCHAPGNTGKVSPDTLTADVPACMFNSLPFSRREYPRQGSREEVSRSAEARPLAAD